MEVCNTLGLLRIGGFRTAVWWMAMIPGWNLWAGFLWSGGKMC